MDNRNFNFIVQLSQIINDDKELETGTFQLTIFEVEVRKIQTYEGDLTINKNTSWKNE